MIQRTLEDLWNKGHLKDLEVDLDRFIHDHAADLRATLREGRGGGMEVARRRYSKGELTDREFADFCVRAVLRRRGSCNPGRDIREQAAEIDAHVEYEGTRRRARLGAAPRERIVQDWAADQAGPWREWRLYQLLYVWDKKADQYLDLLSAPK